MKLELELEVEVESEVEQLELLELELIDPEEYFILCLFFLKKGGSVRSTSLGPHRQVPPHAASRP